jgi:hypothetical protein
VGREAANSPDQDNLFVGSGACVASCQELSPAAPALSPSAERIHLGHDDIRTTINIYGHLLPSVDEALADGLDAMHAQSEQNNVTPLRADDEEPPEAVEA